MFQHLLKSYVINCCPSCGMDRPENARIPNKDGNLVCECGHETQVAPSSDQLNINQMIIEWELGGDK